MSSTRELIIVEQIQNSSIVEVWNAITQHDQMIQWFFSNIPSFEPVVGFETEFLVRSGERNFTHIWKIIEVIPDNKIKYDWSYKDYEGVGFVTFELFEKGGQTLLRLTNVGLETFPNDIPEFKGESCRGGWEYFIQKNLKAYLENKFE